MSNDNTENKKASDIDRHIRVVRQKIDTYLSSAQSSDVLIIKAHLICEYYLNQILLVKEVCDSNEMRKLSFFQKSEKAFDLNNAREKLIYRKVKALNDIRNKTGHELEYTLTESDVDELGYVDGKEYVFKKYDFDEIEKTLHYILINTVLDISLFLFTLIKKEKATLEKG